MVSELDIGPLRSLLAVADLRSFRKASNFLHLSQSAVSQHIRRLEGTVGGSLVERSGRGFRFTRRGEALVADARRLIAVHDEILSGHRCERPAAVVIGATEHAADEILPELLSRIRSSLQDLNVSYRLDRSPRLSEMLERGDIDVAVLMGVPVKGKGWSAGELPMGWFSAPGWKPPATGAWPLVAFSEPCGIRRQSEKALSAFTGRVPLVTAEAAYLDGVVAGVRAGLGIGMLTVAGELPEGIVPRPELPALPAIKLRVEVRDGFEPGIGEKAAAAVRGVLSKERRRPDFAAS